MPSVRTAERLQAATVRCATATNMTWQPSVSYDNHLAAIDQACPTLLHQSREDQVRSVVCAHPAVSHLWTEVCYPDNVLRVISQIELAFVDARGLHAMVAGASNATLALMEVTPQEGLQETFEGRLHADIQMMVVCDGRERTPVRLPPLPLLFPTSSTLSLYALARGVRMHPHPDMHAQVCFFARNPTSRLKCKQVCCSNFCSRCVQRLHAA